MAKQLVREGRHQKALSVLGNFGDITMKQVYAILQGNATLRGISPDVGGVLHEGEEEITFHEEKDLEYKKQLGWLIAGRVMFDDQWYQPYAYITDMGRRDIIGPEAYLKHTKLRPLSWMDEEMDFKRRAFLQRRIGHYMDNPAEDEITAFGVTGEGKQWVLFKKAPGIPPWLESRSDMEAAVQEFLDEGRALERYGHKVWWGNSSETAEEYWDARELGRPSEEAENAWLDEFNEEKQKTFEAECAEYKEIILERNGDNWLILQVEGRGPVRVPEKPFRAWAVAFIARHSDNRAHLPEVFWKPVSHSGMKMAMDDPYHTDWMLGAGLDLYEDYADGAGKARTLEGAAEELEETGKLRRDENPVRKASYKLMFELQQELLNFECLVLSGVGEVSGKVVHPEPGEEVPKGLIAVVPYASPEYHEVLSAKAIISEVGGTLAHLAIVGRELGAKVVVVPKALELYPVGVKVTVDCSNGKVRLED